MPQTKQRKLKVKAKPRKQTQLVVPRPMTTVKRGAGSGLIGDVAGMLADRFVPGSAPLARKAVDALGNGLAYVKSQIKNIVGSGDYTIGEVRPKYNVVMNTDQIPRFQNGQRSFTVSHREYIGQVVSSTTPGKYALQRYAINPASSRTFPWLCKIASSYQKYDIHGMVFEYRTMSGDISGSTNTALGTVALAYSPNPSESAPSTKVDMELYEGVVSVKPSDSALCAIECDKSVRQYNTQQVQPAYVATGTSTTIASATPLNQFMADFGQLWVATSGVQGAGVQLGELWVSYSVEFFAQKQDHFGCLRQLTQVSTGPGGSTIMSPVYTRQHGDITRSITGTGSNLGFTLNFGPSCAGAIFRVSARFFCQGVSSVSVGGAVLQNASIFSISGLSQFSTAYDFSAAPGGFSGRIIEFDFFIDLRSADGLNTSLYANSVTWTEVVGLQELYLNVQECNTALLNTLPSA